MISYYLHIMKPIPVNNMQYKKETKQQCYNMDLECHSIFQSLTPASWSPSNHHVLPPYLNTSSCNQIKAIYWCKCT